MWSLKRLPGSPPLDSLKRCNAFWVSSFHMLRNLVHVINTSYAFLAYTKFTYYAAGTQFDVILMNSMLVCNSEHSPSVGNLVSKSRYSWRHHCNITRVILSEFRKLPRRPQKTLYDCFQEPSCCPHKRNWSSAESLTIFLWIHAV